MLRITFIAIVSLAASVAGDRLVRFQHSFDGHGSFVDRGTVSLPSSATKGVTLTIESAASDPKAVLSALQVLAENKGLYRVRVACNAEESAPPAEECWVSSFIPAEQLLSSGQRDFYTLHMSDDEIVAIDYRVSSRKIESKGAFTSKVALKTADGASVPQVPSELRKQAEKEMKKRRKEEGRKSKGEANGEEGGEELEEEDDGPWIIKFLRKYWIYIVPMVIMQFLKPAEKEREGGAPTTTAAQ